MAEENQDQEENQDRSDYFVTSVPEGMSVQDFFQFKPGKKQPPQDEEDADEREFREEKEFKAFLGRLRGKSLPDSVQKMVDENDLDGLKALWNATR